MTLNPKDSQHFEELIKDNKPRINFTNEASICEKIIEKYLKKKKPREI